MANVRKIDLSPLSLYVSFVIFQRVAISTDFSFSQNPKWKRRDKKRENNFFFLFFIFDRDIRYFPFLSRSVLIVRCSKLFVLSEFRERGGGGNFENFDLKKISVTSSRNLFYIYFYTFWIILEGGGRVFELSGYAINSIKLDRVLCNNR